MALSRSLQARVESDAKSPAFLYVPKGRSVDRNNWKAIADSLKVLDKYRRVPWKEAQPDFVRDLRRRRLIEPYKSYRSGFSAVGRMQFPVWRLLGLAWLNQKKEPEVTEVGKEFMVRRTEARRELLSMQIHRYQFWNPTNSRHFAEFKTVPILALYKLLSYTDWYIDRCEFILLGSRIRNMDDATEVAGLVEDLRSCTEDEKADLYRTANTLLSRSHTKNERGTTYLKVRNNFGYIRNFLSLSKYLKVTLDCIEVPQTHRQTVRRILDASHQAEVIEYQTAEDWLARYGELPEEGRWESPWAGPADAMEYYERIGRIDAAAEALARDEASITTRRLDEYRRVQIQERVLEDILEQNLEQLEPGLSLLGRQFSTAVGPIDLLALDQNKTYVVVELKRGRANDRVIGQVARYLGWVTERMARGEENRARAIVVGREYDAKFSSAIGQLRRVKPFTYDIRVRFEQWNSVASK